MNDVLYLVLSLLVISVAAPVVILFIEILAAILRRRDGDRAPLRSTAERIAVLVPAHNESTRLLPTIADIKPQLNNGDRIVVIADNCSDDTAAVAAYAGADVVERNDASKMGKGYALDWGVHYLRSDPPDIVVIIDADCRVAAHTIDRLVAACALSSRPIQGLYLMTAPAKSAVNYQVAEFAWHLKNYVRPLGLKTLGLPCQLMGTGMAFPWKVISAAILGSSEIVEDLQLGLDLASAGSSPLFCPSALVTSTFPSLREASTTQRQRWEHGHTRMILRAAPRFIWQALTKRNLALLALVLDLAIPPTALLGLMVVIVVALSAIALSVGFSSLPMIVSICTLGTFIIGIFLSWFRHGRDMLPVRAFFSVVHFGVGKLILYRRMISRGVPRQWIRTDRDD